MRLISGQLGHFKITYIYSYLEGLLNSKNGILLRKGHIFFGTTLYVYIYILNYSIYIFLNPFNSKSWFNWKPLCQSHLKNIAFVFFQWFSEFSWFIVIWADVIHFRIPSSDFCLSECFLKSISVKNISELLFTVFEVLLLHRVFSIFVSW